MTNRETIKFRVWNKKNKRWLSANDRGTHCNSNWVLDIFTGKIVDYVECDGEHIPSEEPHHYFDGLTHINESPLALQQYTGLKDKNGIEIYEGDIIKCKGFNGMFDEVGFYYNGSVKHTIVKSGESQIAGFAYIPIDREVIGNIFETPELLKA